MLRCAFKKYLYCWLYNIKGETNMGSAGSGKFGTYRVGNGQATGGKGPEGGTAGGGLGGGIGEIECPSVIENIRLEDVAVSDYYVNHQSLPSSRNLVELNNTVYKGSGL